jgi:hypothetical protein
LNPEEKDAGDVSVDTSSPEPTENIKPVNQVAKTEPTVPPVKQEDAAAAFDKLFSGS